MGTFERRDIAKFLHYSDRFNYELIILPQTRQTQNGTPSPPIAHLSITSSAYGGIKILYQVVWRPAVYLRGVSSVPHGRNFNVESLGVRNFCPSRWVAILSNPRFNKLFMMQWTSNFTLLFAIPRYETASFSSNIIATVLQLCRYSYHQHCYP